jgi:hypothetical protein
MSNLASLITPADDGIYLGTATVVDGGETLRVRREDGLEVDACLALASHYQASEGDVLLVLGREQRHWVVGVVHGQGKTQMAFKGDVELRAVGGTLELRGDDGIRMASPEVDLNAGKLRISAESVLQKCESLYQRVRGLLSVRASQQQTVVDGAIVTKAARADIVASETVSLNGKQINLG